MTAAGFFLRRIEERRWITDPDWRDSGPNYKSPPWLAAGQISGDCVNDLKTEDGRLSVYLVPSAAPEHAMAVGTAIVGRRQKETDFGYCLISPSTLSDLDLQLEASPGETADSEVDGWHFDVINLTGEMILALATLIKKRKEYRDTVLRVDIESTLPQRLAAGTINHRLSKELRAKYQK